MSTPDIDDSNSKGNADQFDFLDDDAANNPARKKKVRRSKELVMPIIRTPVPVSESGPARVGAVKDAVTFEDDFEFLGDEQSVTKNDSLATDPAWNEGLHDRYDDDEEKKSPLVRNLLVLVLGAIVLSGATIAFNWYQKPDVNNQASVPATTVGTEALTVDNDSSISPAIKTLSQRFTDQLQALEAQVAAGDLDAAEQSMASMDRSVFGYGAPEFSAIQQQIDNLRNGIVGSSVGTESVEEAEQSVAAEAERIRLAQEQRLAEIAREEQAALARAEALKQDEAARVVEAERIAQAEQDALAQRQAAEEALAADALRKEEAAKLAEAERVRNAEIEAARLVDAERVRNAEIEAARLVEAERVRNAEIEAARLVEAERVRNAEIEAARLVEAERVRNAEIEAARLVEAERVRNAEIEAARLVDAERVRNAEAAALDAQRLAEEKRIQDAAVAEAARVARVAEVAAAALAVEQRDAAQESLALATAKAAQRLERDRAAQVETDRRIAERARLNEEQAKAAEFTRQQAQAQQQRLQQQRRQQQRRQQQAAEDQLALSQAQEKLQITPKPQNYSITDNDFNFIGGKFIELKSAIESRNIANVIALTQRSGKRVQQMLQLFENNSAIKARLVNVTSRDAEGVIVGQLTIQKLVKNSGVEVDAPTNLSSITLTSRRGPAGWSTIAW